MVLMAVGLLGAVACTSETADDQPEATAAEMPAEGSGMGEEAAAGMGEMDAPHGQVSVIMYQCADDKMFALTVAPGVGQAAIRLEEGVFQLEQQEAASGMEFSDGTYTFRGQGQEAYVEKEGEQILAECVAAGHPEMPATPEN